MLLSKKFSAGLAVGFLALGTAWCSPATADERASDLRNWDISLVENESKFSVGSTAFRKASLDNWENIRQDGSKSISWTVSSPEPNGDKAVKIAMDGTEFSTLGDGTSFIKIDSNKNLKGIFISGTLQDSAGSVFEVPLSFNENEKSVIPRTDLRNVGLKYPVTVTLDAGQDLFGEVKYGEHNGEPKVSFSKSEYGAKNHYPWNLEMFYNEGWDEVLRKDVKNYTSQKASMKHQYDCHVTGGYFSWAGDTWDLEMSRPDLPDWKDKNLFGHRCNWVDAEGNTEGGSSS